MAHGDEGSRASGCSVGLRTCALILTLAVTAIGCSAQREIHWTLPPDTAIPIVFTHTLDAGKLQAGAVVRAKTMQVVHLPQGKVIQRGSLVLGHVVMARPVRRGVSPSVLAFDFDRIITHRGTLTVRLYVRALATPIESSDASYPTPPPDMNLSNQRALIGGDQVTPFERKVYSPESQDDGLDVVGENLKQGIFERLRPALTMNGDSPLRCDGTATQQSVAIYSGNACGLYGFDLEYLAHTGKQNRRIVKIESRYFTIKLYANTTALLQVAPDSSKT